MRRDMKRRREQELKHRAGAKEGEREVVESKKRERRRDKDFQEKVRESGRVINGERQ